MTQVADSRVSYPVANFRFMYGNSKKAPKSDMIRLVRKSTVDQKKEAEMTSASALGHCS